TDGHKYAMNAYNNGCRVFVCEEKLSLPDDATQIIKSDTRIELAKISAEFFGCPAKQLKIIGVTGTKGKTTTELYIWNILKNAGINAGFIGTNGIIINDITIPTVNSTPESYELHKAFAEMVRQGIKYVVMEVSSLAYKSNRVYGIDFEVGVFTNLFPDHIGENEHPDFDDYKSCKARLFENSEYSVFNADDDWCDEMIAHAKANYKTYGLSNAHNITPWQNENVLGVKYNYKNHEVIVKTPGVFSVYNSLAAISVCEILGIDMEIIRTSFQDFAAKGRFELVDALPYAKFIIDYAHNELSLRNVLETLRQYSPRRLVCLFGSIGGRSKLRREGLGKVAAELADFCIITSDNPDNENPLNIIAEIERSVKNCPYIIIPDRKEAIEYAVNNAAEGDIVLLAGKGHEDYQIVNGEHIPFVERKIIMEAAESILSFR
ncbi:MAG: UDP-N-acetylmuramoyl-L-alanyl-D-glutamate--2,6-diaminopimelate ligase, partial [Oscillospiraceae bacterium]|nr:UDP-N-acetylmuramoyl-L-alanyl-D-glutamate--2,6-diaminopimelate ligase [Oscillospiraceae bacterium]